MTVERGDGSVSPVHVHVDEETPVHVHLKKPKKPASHGAKAVGERMADVKRRNASSFGASNLRKSTATARARSKSPGRSKSPLRSKSPVAGPWVPPPGRSTKSKLSWQGPSHRLEIHQPTDTEPTASILRRSELDYSTDDEDRVHNTMRQYEKKIDSLMSEVGSLKNEVDLQRSMRAIEKRDEELELSRQVLEDQEYEIREYKQELELAEKENRYLRHSKEIAEEDVMQTKDHLQDVREKLMKKLVEVELDGQAAAQQVSALRDTIRRLKEEKRMSSSDTTMLAKQKELLLEKLGDFETTNRGLRRMLQDRHEEEADSLRLTEQRDLLLRKLSETEGEFQRLKTDLLDRERQVSDMRLQLDAQKDENVAISGLQTSLESTRAHLQKQLRQKEADCNRMAVQIRSIESQLAQEKIEVDHLQTLLATARDKSEHDKEALKKATRVQKQRAARSEDAVEQLNTQLLERETQVAEMRNVMDDFQSRMDKLSKEKAQSMAENSALKTRISELENLMEHVQESSKSQVEVATARLHEKATESASARLENERLKTSLATIEDKLIQADGEVSQLRSNLKQYETLVDEYRSQMNKSRREADDSIVKLEEQQKETKRVQHNGEIELELVKTRFSNRIQELEALPELLKMSELKLHEAQEQLLTNEKRNTENTKQITELSAKVEHQSAQLDEVREKYHGCQDEGRNIQAKAEAMERKLREVEEQNRDLLTTLAKREEAVHQAGVRLEEKTHENASLNRQLEAALTDARRQTDQIRDKAASKERTSQTRILDLESQISQARAEIARLKREKEEGERRFNSRMYDLKDRLEQSHSTNRSMQNYVHFLKNSYANVFGDAPAVSSPLRPSFH